MKRTVKTRKTDGGCFECVSHAPGRYGYPRATVDGIRDRVHRHVYRKFKGNIPEGKVVRHKCDNRLCCNPDHLEIGTHADNARDRVERGRGAYGERNGRSKLTAVEVVYIRDLRRRGVDVRTIAGLYKVNASTIYRALNKSTWRGNVRRS